MSHTLFKRLKSARELIPLTTILLDDEVTNNDEVTHVLGAIGIAKLETDAQNDAQFWRYSHGIYDRFSTQR